MTKKLKIPASQKGYGYMAVWYDGKVGWMGIAHLSGQGTKYPDEPHNIVQRNPKTKGKRLFLCEITAKPVLDKKGRPITKIVK